MELFGIRAMYENVRNNSCNNNSNSRRCLFSCCCVCAIETTTTPGCRSDGAMCTVRLMRNISTLSIILVSVAFLLDLPISHKHIWSYLIENRCCCCCCERNSDVSRSDNPIEIY